MTQSNITDISTSMHVRPRQRKIVAALWSLAGIVVLGLIVARLIERHHMVNLPILFRTPEFALTDQNGKGVSDADLREHVYVCDFIFTRCGSVCPELSKEFGQLQKELPDEIQLVSFTVDPANDTPAALKAYADLYGADPARWHFLTGTPEQMTDTIRKMKVALEPATDHEPIHHDEHFLLIDATGNVRGVYYSKDAASMKQLINDACALSYIRKKHGL